MNTYTYQFLATCPSDGDLIAYTLTLQSRRTIMAESIVAACDAIDKGFQEDIAKTLFAQFPGAGLVLRATHCGVQIVTELPA